MKRMTFAGMTALLMVLFWPSHEVLGDDLGPDTVVCAESEQKIACHLYMPNFMRQVAYILTNGWENTLSIEITLLDSSGSNTIQRSQLQATQRCYLDPFESPCLILWRGAKSWQSFRGEEDFLKALSSFSIQALRLKSLPAANYRVRLQIKLNPSASKQIEAIQQWLRQSSSDSNSFKLGDTSLVGAYMSTFARNASLSAERSLTLETSQFYIDIAFQP